MQLDNYVWVIIIIVFGILGFFLEKFNKYAFYICLFLGVITASVSVYFLNLS